MQQNIVRNTWDRVLGKLETRVNAHSFSTWFRPTHFVSEDAATLRIRVPNSWFAEWLRTNYLPVIEEALVEMERPGVAVEFLTGDGSHPSRSNGTTAPVTSEPSVPSLNPRYTFDKFGVSSCNQFAHAAAIAVADQPSRAYNPLYIYGGVGLGKTHLMQAIGQRLSQRGGARMRYISTEQFMN